MTENKPLSKEDYYQRKFTDMRGNPLPSEDVIKVARIKQAVQGLLDGGYCESCQDKADDDCKENHPDFVFYYLSDIKEWLGALIE